MLWDYVCDCFGEDVFVTDKLRKSFEDAQANPENCPLCHEPMRVVEVVRFSFSAFKPFRTSAFNSPDDDPSKEIEVNDRAQLRGLLRANGMVERGDRDSRKDVFGSSPKSLPRWSEICKARGERFSPATKKLLKQGMVGAASSSDWKRMEHFDEKTKSGTKENIPMTERDERQLYRFRNG